MYVAEVVVLAGLYAGLGKLGLGLFPVVRFAALVWIPTGLSLAALLVRGLRLWPAVALGAFAVNLWNGAPPLVALGIAAGNTLEAVLAAYAVRRVVAFRGALDRVADVGGLVVLAALLSTTVSATIGVASLGLGGVAHAAALPGAWVAWWAGDMLSDLVVAPAILTWAAAPRPGLAPAPRAEAVLAVVILSAYAGLVCGLPHATVAAIPILRSYLLLLPLAWLVLRFGPRGGATGVLALAVASIAGTYAGHGIFAGPNRNEGLLDLHVFLVAAALASLILAAVVSERERSRVEVMRAEEVRESEARLRLAAEGAHLGMWFWDIREGRLTWNEPCRALHGIGRDEEVTYARFVAMVHPDDRARVERAIRRAIDEACDYAAEHRVVLPDGGVRWLRSLGRVFHDDRGAPVRMMGVSMDITSRRRADEERAALLERERAARAAAQDAARAKDEFLAVVSHELRTPLQAMLGWTQVLLSQPPDERTLAKGLATLDRSVKAQARLIEDLLDVSRIVAGKLRLERVRVDLAQVVEAAVEAARPAAAAKGVCLDASIEALPGEVIGDPHRLQQVVANLLSNGTKFTPSGGLVAVRLRRELAAAKIRVEDTGAGIPKDFLPFVFDRFRQAEGASTRAHGGLGLGLAIARHLVEMHGGSVRAESAGEGRGAAFTVTLPLVGARRALSGERPESARGSPRAVVSLSGVRVLVVDDDAATCELLEMALHRAGADVRAVRSARAALEELPSFCPDVLLSDIGMPEEDGYALIQKVRAMESAAGGHVPAVALTAFASQSDREQALAIGFDAHVSKPASPRELSGTVAALAARR